MTKFAGTVLFATVAMTAASIFALPVHASAQQPDTLRARYLIALPPTIEVLSTVSRAPPGTSAGSPTAFGPNWGDGFVGGGVVNRQRFDPGTSGFRGQVDGSVVAGFGLGNARDLIGLEVAIASFSTFDSGFFTRAGVSLKAHRVLLGNWGIGVGMENAFTRGPVDADPSYYAVVSRVWPQDWWNPFRTLSASLGVGNGRFRFEDDMLADRKRVNAFGSLSVRIWEPFSLIADWTGQDLTLAASFVPFVGIPLIITPGVADITGMAGDGPRVTLGAGMGFQFASLGRLFP